MQYHLSKRTRLWFSCLLGLMLPAPFLRAQEYDPEWTKHFRVGLLVGMNIKADFKTSGSFGISSPQQAGVYDDGYVLSSGLQNGYTSNWGYENQSQNPTGTDILLMHRATSFSATGRSEADNSAFTGFDMEYGGILRQWSWTRLGWDFGFGLLPVSFSARQSMSGTVSGTTYTYNTGNPNLPEAPYHGNSSSSPESSIRTDDFSTSNETFGSGSVSGTQKLDANLYTFRLGPSLYMDLTPYIGVSVGAGPALGFVSGRLQFDETITVDDTGNTTRNKGSVSDSDLVFGGYVNAMVTYHAVANGDFYLGAQYMPLGTAKIGGSGREARLKMDGQIYLSAGINWPF